MTSDARLTAAIRQARERWASGSHLNEGWEPQSEKVGTAFRQSDQALAIPVPTVPTVPTPERDTLSSTMADAHVSAWADWVERAAILEFSGGLGRGEAEARAAIQQREIMSRGGMVV